MALSGWHGAVAAQEITAEIIQIKSGRLYFSVGSESGIKSGGSFTVRCGFDSVLSGKIEYSGPSISFSNVISNVDYSSLDSTCMVTLTGAAIDPRANIIIGSDLPPELFNPERETIFLCIDDKDDDAGAGSEPSEIVNNLVDSVLLTSSKMTLYLPPDIFFSDGSRLNAPVLAEWLADLKVRSRSNLVRFFFARLLPADQGGIEVVDQFTLKMRFNHPFPHVTRFLSHPDFSVYNYYGKGTGPLVATSSEPGKKVFVPHRQYHGNPVQFQMLTVRFFSQSHKLRFAFEQGMIDGYLGFGFDSELEGHYDHRAEYPYMACLVSGVGGKAFANGRFPTALYYSFDFDLAHLLFPRSRVKPVKRWYTVSEHDNNGDQKYYSFDPDKGRALLRGIGTGGGRFLTTYDHTLLYKTARYLADLAAREKRFGEIEPYDGRAGNPDQTYDLRLAFFPASDKIIPFGLYAAVLELNDQNRYLPRDLKLDRPGWSDALRGSGLTKVENRGNYFARAEEALIEDGCFYPLYRPFVYAVTGPALANIRFDHFGYPLLSHARKIKGDAR